MKLLIIFPALPMNKISHAIFLSSSHVAVRGKVTFKIAVAYYSERTHSLRIIPYNF